jgi:hypothetical protein
MLTPQTTLKRNEADVIAKVLDGEAILINVTSGAYHSLTGAGAVVWELIEGAQTLERIAAALAERYDATLDQIQTDVLRVASDLQRENLVVESENAEAAVALEPVAAKQPYETPSLNTFRDMTDLLALDPPTPGLQQIPWDKPKNTDS